MPPGVPGATWGGAAPAWDFVRPGGSEQQLLHFLPQTLGACWVLASALGLGPAGSGQTAPTLGEAAARVCVTCPVGAARWARQPCGSMIRRSGGGSLLSTERPLAGLAAEWAWPCLLLSRVPERHHPATLPRAGPAWPLFKEAGLRLQLPFKRGSGV